MCPDLTGGNTTRTHERTAPDAMRRPPGPRKGTTAVPARPKTTGSHALARMPAVPAARVRRSPLPRRRPRTLATGVCGRPGPAFPAEPDGRCHAGTPLAVRPETVSAQSGANPRSPGTPRSSKRTRTNLPQPKRWVVEQVNGTLMLQRRLARDYDHRPDNAASRVCEAATVGMLRRPTTPTAAWRDDVEPVA